LYKSLRHRLRVRYNECDPLGIVFNANFLVYTDIAINELWRAHLGGYDKMMEDGLDLAVVEANLRYLAPLRFDDEFDIEIRIDHIGDKSMTALLDFTKDSEEVAAVTMTYVCIDSETKISRSIPDSIREALTA
jgi:acyl-CoA thioester hydrolase